MKKVRELSKCAKVPILPVIVNVIANDDKYFPSVLIAVFFLFCFCLFVYFLFASCFVFFYTNA